MSCEFQLYSVLQFYMHGISLRGCISSVLGENLTNYHSVHCSGVRPGTNLLNHSMAVEKHDLTMRRSLCSLSENSSKSKFEVTSRLMVSQSLCQGIEPILRLVTRYYCLFEGCFLKFAVLSLSGALSDERSDVICESSSNNHCHSYSKNCSLT
jgi:hypothetical protein